MEARFLPNEYRECADEDGVMRKYKVPVHEASFKAGIKEVVKWIEETAILGYKEGELGVKPPTDWVLDLYLWQAFKESKGIEDGTDE